MTLSATAVQAFADEETDEVWLCLLTIAHDDLSEPLRCVNNIEDVFSQGQDYIGLPYEIDLPGDDGEGPTEARIKVDNVDRRIVEALRSISTPPEVTIEVVTASALDEPELSIPGLTLRNASYDAGTVQASLRYEDLTIEPIAETITPGRFPGLL